MTKDKKVFLPCILQCFIMLIMCDTFHIVNHMCIHCTQVFGTFKCKLLSH